MITSKTCLLKIEFSVKNSLFVSLSQRERERKRMSLKHIYNLNKKILFVMFKIMFCERCNYICACIMLATVPRLPDREFSAKSHSAGL